MIYLVLILATANVFQFFCSLHLERECLGNSSSLKIEIKQLKKKISVLQKDNEILKHRLNTII